MKILDHEALGISFKELGALLGTRAMLEKKVLIDAKGDGTANNTDHKFNMNITCDMNGCGTVACIGGTMALIMGMPLADAQSYVDNVRGNLESLFWPRGISNWSDIKPRQAIKAIDNFLTTGDPKWATATSMPRRKSVRKPARKATRRKR